MFQFSALWEYNTVLLLTIQPSLINKFYNVLVTIGIDRFFRSKDNIPTKGIGIAVEEGGLLTYWES